jgi:hypothetical protein
MTVSKHWCNLEIDTNKPKDLNFVFGNHGEEDEIYPLTTIKIAKAQRKDRKLKDYYKKNARMQKEDIVVSRLDMYHTNVLMYCTMVLLACQTKVRC